MPSLHLSTAAKVEQTDDGLTITLPCRTIDATSLAAVNQALRL